MVTEFKRKGDFPKMTYDEILDMLAPFSYLGDIYDDGKVIEVHICEWDLTVEADTVLSEIMLESSGEFQDGISIEWIFEDFSVRWFFDGRGD